MAAQRVTRIHRPPRRLLKMDRFLLLLHEPKCDAARSYENIFSKPSVQRRRDRDGNRTQPNKDREISN